MPPVRAGAGRGNVTEVFLVVFLVVFLEVLLVVLLVPPGGEQDLQESPRAGSLPPPSYYRAIPTPLCPAPRSLRERQSIACARHVYCNK